MPHHSSSGGQPAAVNAAAVAAQQRSMSVYRLHHPHPHHAQHAHPSQPSPGTAALVYHGAASGAGDGVLFSSATSGMLQLSNSSATSSSTHLMMGDYRTVMLTEGGPTPPASAACSHLRPALVYTLAEPVNGWIPSTPITQTMRPMRAIQVPMPAEESSAPTLSTATSSSSLSRFADRDQAGPSLRNDSDTGKATPIPRLPRPQEACSFDSPREIAASVLLLAAGAHAHSRQQQQQLQQEQDQAHSLPPSISVHSHGDSKSPGIKDIVQPGDSAHGTPASFHQHETENESDTEPSMPLKKRKKVADILRRKPEAEMVSQVETQPCQVSPMSHNSPQHDHPHHSDSSPKSHSDGNVSSSDAATTPVSTLRNHHHLHAVATGVVSSSDTSLHADTQDSASPDSHHLPNSHRNQPTATQTSLATSRASSYDWKEGQALPDSAKLSDVTHLRPLAVSTPEEASVGSSPHFPSVLYEVLTESEFAGSVLQWLPHGQAWRIVRWDALRRQALPKHFPQWNEASSQVGGATASVSGSVDAFLWNVAAWGFEEITSGPDVGAYHHVHFRRGNPELCRAMRFAPGGQDEVKAGHPGGKANRQSESDVHSHDQHEEDDRSEASAEEDRKITCRTILQVPSLATTGTQDSVTRSPGGEAGVAGELAAGSGNKRRPSPTGMRKPLITPQQYDQEHGVRPPGGAIMTNMNVHQVWPLRRGPVFVNYRPEEMSLSDGAWQPTFMAQMPTTDASGTVTWISQQTQQHQQQQGLIPSSSASGVAVISPSGAGTLAPARLHTRLQPDRVGVPSALAYSPVRIRSGRGAGRIGRPRTTSYHDSKGSSSLSPASTKEAESATPPRSGFPVSNRGRARRVTLPMASNLASNSRSDASTSSQADSTKDSKGAALTDVSPTVARTVPDKLEVIATTGPRSVLKRKLPLSGSTGPRGE